MEFSEERNKECKRLQEWVENNMEDWLTICGVEKKISKTEYYRLKDILFENRFDQIVFVLFTIHGYALNEEYGDYRMVVMDMLINVCKNRGIKLSKYPSIYEVSEKLGLKEENEEKFWNSWNDLNPGRNPEKKT